VWTAPGCCWSRSRPPARRSPPTRPTQPDSASCPSLLRSWHDPAPRRVSLRQCIR
jgi:hypothetical protein